MSTTPDEWPVLVWDGECRFCRSWLEWLQDRVEWWPAMVASQQADLAALALTQADVDRAVWFVAEDGRRLGGPLAVAAILDRQAHAGWRAAGWLLRTWPTSRIAATVYRLIARNRRRLPHARARRR